MRLFIQMEYRNTELNTLNRCQLYTQVVFLSDICNAAGTKLEQQLWNQLTVADSPYRWPIVPKPTPMEWRLWQQVLQKAMSVGRNLAIPLPLDKWHSRPQNAPGWYYHAQENTLYHHTEEGYTRHSMYPRWSRMQAFHQAGEVPITPPSKSAMQIATVALQGEFFAYRHRHQQTV